MDAVSFVGYRQECQILFGLLGISAPFLLVPHHTPEEADGMTNGHSLGDEQSQWWLQLCEGFPWQRIHQTRALDLKTDFAAIDAMEKQIETIRKEAAEAMATLQCDLESARKERQDLNAAIIDAEDRPPGFFEVVMPFVVKVGEKLLDAVVGSLIRRTSGGRGTSAH